MFERTHDLSCRVRTAVLCNSRPAVDAVVILPGHFHDDDLAAIFVKDSGLPNAAEGGRNSHLPYGHKSRGLSKSEQEAKEIAV